jgi:Ni/Co efflux regulator RcnB
MKRLIAILVAACFALPAFAQTSTPPAGDTSTQKMDKDQKKAERKAKRDKKKAERAAKKDAKKAQKDAEKGAAK